MISKIYRFFASLSLSLWLTGGIMLFLGIGSFAGGGDASSMNDMPLLVWLEEAPFHLSWWLWLTVVLIALLVANTLTCSIESLRAKTGKSRFLVLISPQVIHLGFLFIVLAHLVSAKGSFKQGVEITEGTAIGFPDGSTVRVGRISTTMGARGMVTDFAADVRIVGEGGKGEVIRPNRPFFHRGYGLYLKNAEPFPLPNGYMEIHREPGAGLALLGGVLFTVGNIVLLAVRRGK